MIDGIREDLADIFAAEEWRADRVSITFYGRLLTDSRTVARVARERLEARGLLPFLRRGKGVMVLQVMRKGEEPRQHSPLIHLALFLATVVTTCIAGAVLVGVHPFKGGGILAGIPFSFTLLTILGMHELAHYVVSRRHGCRVSLPYFIPAPTLIGTMGAIIKIRSHFRDRRSLLDVGIAGPLASFILGTAAMCIGLHLSKPVRATGELTFLGDSILTWLLSRLIVGDLSPGMILAPHPAVLAGWFGLLITGINLLPVGQLDGGHISYALLGQRHVLAGKITAAAIAGLGVITGFYGWIVFLVLVAFLVRFRHPAPLDDVTGLEPWRKALGWVALVLLVLTFIPMPIGRLVITP